MYDRIEVVALPNVVHVKTEVLQLVDQVGRAPSVVSAFKRVDFILLMSAVIQL